MQLQRKLKVATLAGVITAAAALGLTGATAPAAQASDGCGTVAEPAPTAATRTLVFGADPALAGQPCVILAVDATTGAVAPVGGSTVAPGTNVIVVPATGTSDYAVVTPGGPVIWAKPVEYDEGSVL